MTCPSCGLSQAEHEGLMNDLQLSDKEVRRLRRVEQGLKNQLNEQRATSPIADQVREVLEHYVMRFRKKKSFKVGPDTARWALVEKQLKADHTVAELKEAIDGLHARPYVGGNGEKGRTATGTEDQRFDEIELCLRNEMFIDRFRGYAQRARQESEVQPPVLWQPMERILIALRDRGLKWDGAFMGVQMKAGVAWKAWGQCPLCVGKLLVGVRDNGWATLECEVGCDFFRVLEALEIDPAELARPFDPATIPAPSQSSTRTLGLAA